MEYNNFIHRFETESLLLIRDQICHYQDVFEQFNYYSYPLHSMMEKLDSLLDELDIKYPTGSIGEYLSKTIMPKDLQH